MLAVSIEDLDLYRTIQENLIQKVERLGIYIETNPTYKLTVERIRSLVEMKDIFISTNKDYKKLVLEQLPEIPEENILCEPVGRNTAPCIGLGAIHVEKNIRKP